MCVKNKHDDIDWNRSIKTLMEELGLSKSTVMKYRAVHGLNTHSSSKRWLWESVDWCKDISMIMEDTDTAEKTVRYNKAIYCECHDDPFKTLLESLEWNKTDTELVNNTGLTREVIRKYRKIYGGAYRFYRDSDMFWDSIDWDKQTRDIVAETGFCYETVRRRRLEHGHPATKQGLVRTINFSLSDEEIAEQYGIDEDVVWHYRAAANNVQTSARRATMLNKTGSLANSVGYKALKPKKNPKVTKVKKTFQWELVDWQKPISQIAEELGCKPWRVHRAKRHYAVTVKKIDWSSVDWNKTTKQLAAELGCSAGRIYMARKKYAKDEPYKNDRAKLWSRVDWSKSDWQIRREIGCCLESVKKNRKRYGNKAS